MTRHVKNYLEHFGYDKSDGIFCEHPTCWALAVDIHHIEPRSHFGTKTRHLQDHVSNLAALCRRHHDEAHGPNSREIKERLKQIVKNRDI